MHGMHEGDGWVVEGSVAGQIVILSDYFFPRFNVCIGELFLRMIFDTLS